MGGAHFHLPRKMYPPPLFPCTSRARLFKVMGSSNEYHVVKIINFYNKHISRVTLRGNELLQHSKSLNSQQLAVIVIGVTLN